MLLDFRRCQWEMKSQAFQKKLMVTKRRMAQLAELVSANPTVQDYLMAGVQVRTGDG